MKHLIKYCLDYRLTNNPPCYISDAVVNGLFDVGSSIIGGIGKLFGAKDANQKNFEYNQKLMEQQQRYNVQNMNMQRDINKELARYGYDLENEYNSPSAQKSKMLAAGLNPYYNDEGAVSAASNPNMQSVSQPSVSIPNFQAQSPWSAFSHLPDDLALIANATKSIAEAKKAGVETELQERAMEDYINDIHEKWRGSKLANDYQEVITNWYQDSGRHYLDEQDRKVTMEIGNLLAQGNLADAERFLTDEKQKQLHNENSLWSHIKDYIVRQKAAEAEDAEARVNTTKAQGEMYKNQGQAALSNAVSTRIMANAAFKQAVTAEENGKSYRINLQEANRLTQAQKNELIQNSIAMYEDKYGVHLNKEQLANAQSALRMVLYSSSRQQFINSINPLTYLGSIFGGAGAAIVTKVAK